MVATAPPVSLRVAFVGGEVSWDGVESTYRTSSTRSRHSIMSRASPSSDSCATGSSWWSRPRTRELMAVVSRSHSEVRVAASAGGAARNWMHCGLMDVSKSQARCERGETVEESIMIETIRILYYKNVDVGTSPRRSRTR
jgi:hypothetical protein